jgi:two-component system, OmpR family, phosphate regulon sensor histidine kinase PhoR
VKFSDRLARRFRRLFRSWQISLSYFPWQTASRTYLLQVLGFLAGLVATGYTLRHQAILLLMKPSQPDEALASFDRQLSWLFAVFLALGLLWLAFVTYTELRPMGRILRALKRKKLGATSSDAEYAELVDAYFDEPGEWQDLEKTVTHLSRGVRQNEAQLVREREELVTILGSVNEAIVAMGTDTEPLYYNSRFAVLFGSGSTGGDAIPLRERFRLPELLSGFNRVLSEGMTRTFRVKLRTSLHDTERDFSVAVSPLMTRDERSVVYGAVAIFHDITELKASEQIRIDFVANASHELKTPLTSIKGYVDTVRADLKDGRLEDVPGFLDVVSRNVDRLILLVGDLLDLSVLDSGAEVRKTVLSTQEISEQALKLIESRRTKRHTIYLETKADRVLGDPRRIEQVLVNLIDNATKYSPDNAEIRITWEQGQGANQGDTVLSIRDTGPGIPEEHLPRLFERFYRVDAGRAREVGGTGLGLAIVKHIVLGHGGSIAVRSKPGEGSEFICRFPPR